MNQNPLENFKWSRCFKIMYTLTHNNTKQGDNGQREDNFKLKTNQTSERISIAGANIKHNQQPLKTLNSSRNAKTL